MGDSNFAKIPEALIFDSNISSTAVRVYGVLQRYAGKRRTAFPGREQIAQHLGVNVVTIKRSLGELADSGWIERTRRPGSNVWDTELRASADPDHGYKNDPRHGYKNDPRLDDHGYKNDPGTGTKMTRPSGTKMTRLDEREPMNESYLTRITAHGSADAAPDADIIDAEVIDELPLNLPAAISCDPDPVQLLVGAYVTAVEADGGIATKSQRGAIGRNVKRLIADDGIPLPVLLVAVQRAGTRRSPTVDRFLGEVQTAYGRESTRRAMFDRWAEIAEQIDGKGQLA